jgi:hypothetical protein
MAGTNGRDRHSSSDNDYYTIAPKGLTSSPTGTFYFAYGSNLSTTQMGIRCHQDPRSSQPVAIARLDDYKWIICQRGYANVVALPPLQPQTNSSNTSSTSPKSETKTPPSAHSTNKRTVYGLLYNLSPADEARLDLYEGHEDGRNPHPEPNPDPKTAAAIPFLQGRWDYNKHYLPVTITKWLMPPEDFGLTSVPQNVEAAAAVAKAEQVTVLVYVDELRTSRGTINDPYIGRMNRGINEAVALGLDEAWIEEVMRGDIPSEGVAEEGYVGEVEGYVEQKE